MNNKNNLPTSNEDFEEIKYDERGNEIYARAYDGFECWSEYDQNGNRIHFKDSTGYEDWKTYNEDNLMMYYKDTYGKEFTCEYKILDNKILHCTCSNGHEYTKEFDKNTKRIKYTDNKGIKITYNANDTMINLFKKNTHLS